jgi:DNA-binding CsgD family transcriptional regulator
MHANTTVTLSEALDGEIVIAVRREIVGREEELATLRRFLERPVRTPATLVVEGEAGIGKSTLWLAGVAEARGRDLRVLSSRPAEAERGLAFAGLGDLFHDVLDVVLPELSPPRRRALAIALLVEEATGAADPRALGVAVRNAIELLAGDGPLVIAIDDLQWLDPSSASVLSFALRRLDGHVVLLLARRIGEPTEATSLEHSLHRDQVERMRLGPLSAGALQKLLRARLGRVFARPTLLRIHEACGGNPFYALEVATALGPDVDPTQPLPIPETLEELVHARLELLPETTRHALMLASFLGTPSLKLLRAAGVEQDALEPALAARVVEQSEDAIVFTHPLLASALFRGLSAAERRRAHRALAEVVVDPIERARHLALSSDGPDSEIAAALEAAAALASARGAMVAAAELGEYALRLTPSGAHGEEHRRTIAAGRAHMAAGEAERARKLGRTLKAHGLDGKQRAERLLFLSELEPGPLQQRIALRRQALQDSSLPVELRLLVHERLALETRFIEGGRSAQKHAEAAVELAEQLDDDAARAGALAALAMLRFNAGKRDALRRAEQAFEVAKAAGDLVRILQSGFCLSHILIWSEESSRARGLLENLYGHGAERDERASAQILWYLSLVELRAGRFRVAAEHAERSRELSVQYGHGESEEPQNLFPVALVAAHRGELESARSLADAGSRLAEKQEALLPGLNALSGLIHLWSGDAAEAVERFATAETTARAAGWAEPGLRWWRADYVEALLELERIDEAVSVLEPWEADGARLGRGLVLAQATRCRGLVSAAKGDVVRASLLLESAIAGHEEVGDPFGRARTLLALGVLRRRARQKRAAREAIEEALAGFTDCGAEGWTKKAGAELGRIGGRRREEGLTAAESRVAALVAEGRTNREVAAALFLGERTVETHLSHIYAKLGVRSRTELARTLRRES